MIKKPDKSKKREAGQAMVEFALVLPLFLLILFFIIDFGWIAFQQASFEYGYMQSSWSVTAADIGDNDPVEEVPSSEVFAGSVVADAIRKDILNSTIGIIKTEILVSDASATFYNKEKRFELPGHDPEEVNEGRSITRYMDLEATIRYRIEPLTFVGKLFFGRDVYLNKVLERTRVVRSQSRTE